MKDNYIKLNLNDIERYIGNFSLYCYFMLTGYIFLISYEHTLFLARGVFLLIGSSIGWHYALGIKKIRSFLSKFTAILVFSYVACYIFQEDLNYSIKYFLYSICYIGMSVLLLKNQFSSITALAIYYSVVGIILLKLWLYESVNFVILNNSRNYISVLLMFFCLFYYIIKYKNREKWSLLPAILLFLLSVVATGRGGIIASGFLLLAVLFCKQIRMQHKYKKYIYLLLLMPLCLCTALMIDVTDLFPAFQSKGFIDSPRLTIWQTYLNNNLQSAKDFIFSSNIQKAALKWNGNLHNSFLQAYASFGVLFIVIFAFIILLSFISGVKNKEYFFCALFLGLILRSLTDRLFFSGYNEIYLYFFILYFKMTCVSSWRINHE